MQFVSGSHRAALPWIKTTQPKSVLGNELRDEVRALRKTPSFFFNFRVFFFETRRVAKTGSGPGHTRGDLKTKRNRSMSSFFFSCSFFGKSDDLPRQTQDQNVRKLI